MTGSREPPESTNSFARLVGEAIEQGIVGGGASLAQPWSIAARDEQRPPDHENWFTWLLMTGRGWGKTWTGSGYTVDEVKARRARRIALVAGTAADARDVMIEGESGLLAASRAAGIGCTYYPSKRRVEWENGARATAFSAVEPERLRGPEHDFAWCDELRTWKSGRDVWDNLMLTMRLGAWPRVVATTTPLALRWLKAVRDSDRTHVTLGSTRDNLANLSPVFQEAILERYAGTRLEAQEIEGQWLEDVEGALWSRELLIEQHYLELPQVEIDGEWWPDIVRSVVALDPAVTSGSRSDETGIVNAVKAGDGIIYIMHDWSVRAKPLSWARRAIELYDTMEADRIVAEVNQGGDLVEEMMRVVRPSITVQKIRATRGKVVRAEPIAALFEQDKVRFIGSFPELEDQLANFTIDGYVGDDSPDRADAMVYAVTELSKKSGKLQIGTAGRRK